MSDGVHQVRTSPRIPCKADFSLSNRIQSGLGDKATHGRFIVEDRPMVDASLPLPHDPIEELWTLQVALRRVFPYSLRCRVIADGRVNPRISRCAVCSSLWRGTKGCE